MFIDRAKNVSTNSVRRIGIQLECHRPPTSPLRTGTEDFSPSIYKHVTPTGVKAFPFNEGVEGENP